MGVWSIRGIVVGREGEKGYRVFDGRGLHTVESEERLRVGESVEVTGLGVRKIDDITEEVRKTFHSMVSTRVPVPDVLKPLEEELNWLYRELMFLKITNSRLNIVYHADADGSISALFLKRFLRANFIPRKYPVLEVDVALLRERGTFIFLDCCGTKESEEGLGMVEEYGGRVIVIDHHKNPADVGVVVNPWREGVPGDNVCTADILEPVMRVLGVDTKEVKIARAGDKVGEYTREERKTAMAVNMVATDLGLVEKVINNPEPVWRWVERELKKGMEILERVTSVRDGVLVGNVGIRIGIGWGKVATEMIDEGKIHTAVIKTPWGDYAFRSSYPIFECVERRLREMSVWISGGGHLHAGGFTLLRDLEEEEWREIVYECIKGVSERKEG